MVNADRLRLEPRTPDAWGEIFVKSRFCYSKVNLEAKKVELLEEI